MRTRLAIRIHAFLERRFPERRVFLKSDSDTRFIRLRSETQLLAVAGATLFVAWAIVATAIVLMDSIGAGNFRELAKRDQQTYRERLNAISDERDARAEEALKRVGLWQDAGKRTADLSHGQRRQLEVAVALTLKPRLFLMDEPMAGLGASGSKALTGFLDELRHEAPILLVEHDMDAVFALADRISVLVYGEVIATGTADEIRQDPQVRQAYLGDEEEAS